MFPRKKWKILNEDPTRSIIDVLLENRSLPADHLEPFKLSDRMHSPELLPDMAEGVQRVSIAIEKNEKICIFGDYDVDGITSTALMIYFFRRINYPVDWMLPHREKDGYGLRSASIDQIAGRDVDLIITVDNGITSHEAIDHAKSLGIDVVVTDHHLQEGEIPDQAVAVINPNRTDSRYPFKDICGAVVAFKFIYALGTKFLDEADLKQFLLDQLDLVSFGTISDVMPLRDENYALVKFGLKVLSRTRKPGLIELKKISGVNQNAITPITVGFILGPRLNASGRMEEADTALKLLISTSPPEAEQLAKHLDYLNKQRQKLQSGYLEQAQKQLDRKALDNKALIVEQADWQAGLIGLISGQLKEKYARPAIAFTQDEDGNFVGSARSIDQFHITNALTKFNQYFITYGGHQKAAGLTVYQDKYDIFKNEFLQFVNDTLEFDQLVPEIVIDSVIDTEQINLANARTIQEVGPFGETNPEPLFLLKGVLIRDMKLLSKGKHLKMFMQKENQVYETIWWNSGEYKDKIEFGEKLDIVFKLNINMWRGTDRLQLILEDLRIS